MLALSFILLSFSPPEKKSVVAENPLMKPFTTSFQVPPFGEIALEHYLPAIGADIKINLAEIDAVANNPATPDFKNTILAYDIAGDELSVATRIFSNLNGANTNPVLTAKFRDLLTNCGTDEGMAIYQ